MLMRGLRELHPGQANRRPALFILEVSAALPSGLALREGRLKRMPIAPESHGRE
jgi:hypothetical protein